MDRKATIALALAVLAAVVVLAAVFAVGGGEETEEKDTSAEVTASVWLDMGDGSEPAKGEGTGDSVRDILDDALKGHTIEYRSNGTVKSVDGKEGTDSAAWTVFRWASPGGWAVFEDRESSYTDGMSIALRLSERYTDPDGKVAYRAPDIDVEYQLYFYFQMKENFGATPWLEKLPMTEEELKEGLWITGTGSTSNEALADAVLKTFFPDSEYTVEKGSDGDKGYIEYIVDGEKDFFRYGERLDMYGWFLKFLGWEDTQNPDGSYTYWSQYTYSPEAENDSDPIYWEYDQLAFGMYDITDYRYFAVVMDTTEVEPSSMQIDLPPPSTIPQGL